MDGKLEMLSAYEGRRRAQLTDNANRYFVFFDLFFDLIQPIL